MIPQYEEIIQLIENNFHEISLFHFFWTPWKKIHFEALQKMELDFNFQEKNSWSSFEEDFLKKRLRLYSSLKQFLKQKDLKNDLIFEILSKHDKNFYELIFNYKNDAQKKMILQLKVSRASSQYFNNYLGG